MSLFPISLYLLTVLGVESGQCSLTPVLSSQHLPVVPGSLLLVLRDIPEACLVVLLLHSQPQTLTDGQEIPTLVSSIHKFLHLSLWFSQLCLLAVTRGLIRAVL